MPIHLSDIQGGAKVGLQFSVHTSLLLYYYLLNMELFSMQTINLLFFLDFTYLFLERKEGEREGEKYQCVVDSRTPPTGDLACNPGMCPDWESNQRPFGSQARAQSTEPHQPGL